MSLTTKYQDYPDVNRSHKDRVFCLSFEKKEDLLALYNAINNTHYQDPDDLIVTTMENAIYMGIKNDISFLVGGTMNLYEHQSTYNPNMPLRGLLYFGRLFDGYIELNNLDIYSSTLQKIPTPRYIVFYNGVKNEPDKKVLRLSDAFERADGCLECEVTMLNINYGHNRELMEKCRRLEEYAIFVEKVRSYVSKEEQNRKAAVCRAVDECIEENILTDILTKQKAEVVGMILTTFNKELYEKNLKAEAYDAGKSDGYDAGKSDGYIEGMQSKLQAQIQKKLEKNKTIEEIAEDLEESVETIQKIIDSINI